MKKKQLLPLGILAALVLAALIYMRPMTLEAMFGLDITQSELVYTDYLTVSIDEPGRSVESSEWLRGEERTETLISLLSQQKFRRSLRNLLPLETTSDMPQNNLIFDADFSFNDGQDYLYFQSSFGQLNLFSTTGNNLMLCTTSRQKEFLQQVYDMPVESNGYKDWPQGPGTYGEAGIVMEVGTGTILYAKNIDAHEYPASITKVLTALVALENGQLTDNVTFSHDSVAFLQRGDSSVGLKEGNVITLDQAIHAMLLASANEAAYAIGESVGVNAGHDYNWFIEQMNSRCKELGGENSNFANTNGLHDPNHYTCARDMALIGRELFKHPEFFQIVQTLNYTIPASETTEEHVFHQKHKMLQPSNSNYYPYTIGGKTGYTSDALSTLITMADNGQTQLVCVVLRTHGKNIYPDTTNLFEYAFNNFTKVDVTTQEKSEDIETFLTEDGQSEPNYVMLPNGVDFTALDQKITQDTEDSSTGIVTYSYDGHELGTAKVKLSKSYLKAHTDSTQDESKSSGHDNSKKQTKSGKHLSLGTTKGKVILGLSILLVILIITFIATVFRIRKKSNKRKSNKRKKQ